MQRGTKRTLRQPIITVAVGSNVDYQKEIEALGEKRDGGNFGKNLRASVQTQSSYMKLYKNQRFHL